MQEVEETQREREEDRKLRTSFGGNARRGAARRIAFELLLWQVYEKGKIKEENNAEAGFPSPAMTAEKRLGFMGSYIKSERLNSNDSNVSLLKRHVATKEKRKNDNDNDDDDFCRFVNRNDLFSSFSIPIFTNHIRELNDHFFDIFVFTKNHPSISIFFLFLSKDETQYVL